MIIIDVKKEKSLDSALKKLKTKFSNSKVKEELFERKEFVKKSVLKREKIRKARHKQSLLDREENNF